MAGINGLFGGPGAVAANRGAVPARRTGPNGFRVAEEGARGPAALGAVAMPCLLGLQEAQGDAVSDRDARRHADDMLDALRDLQREMLGGGGADGGAGDGGKRLAQLARRVPQAADPGLLAVQRALAVRAAVEGARRRAAASS